MFDDNLKFITCTDENFKFNDTFAMDNSRRQTPRDKYEQSSNNRREKENRDKHDRRCSCSLINISSISSLSLFLSLSSARACVTITTTNAAAVAVVIVRIIFTLLPSPSVAISLSLSLSLSLPSLLTRVLLDAVVRASKRNYLDTITMIELFLSAELIDIHVH